jgi:hypothetical protein
MGVTGSQGPAGPAGPSGPTGPSGETDFVGFTKSVLADAEFAAPREINNLEFCVNNAPGAFDDAF